MNLWPVRSPGMFPRRNPRTTRISIARQPRSRSMANLCFRRVPESKVIGSVRWEPSTLTHTADGNQRLVACFVSQVAVPAGIRACAVVSLDKRAVS